MEIGPTSIRYVPSPSNLPSARMIGRENWPCPHPTARKTGTLPGPSPRRERPFAWTGGTAVAGGQAAAGDERCDERTCGPSFHGLVIALGANGNQTGNPLPRKATSLESASIHAAVLAHVRPYEIVAARICTRCPKRSSESTTRMESA